MTVPTRERRILGVKHSQSKTNTVIGFQNWNDVSHSWDNLTIESSETPAPEFVDALGALSESVCAIIAWPHGWAKEITVTGFRRKLDESENVSVILKGFRTIEGSARPFIINTPLTKIEADPETGSLPMHLARLEELLNAAVTEAKGFLDGRRGQMSLEFPGEGEGEAPNVSDEVPGEGFVDIEGVGAKPKKPSAKRKPARTAKGKGEQAREDNQEMSDNPYDPKGEYDSYTSWNLGWQEKDSLIRREAELANEPEYEVVGDDKSPIGDE